MNGYTEPWQRVSERLARWKMDGYGWYPKTDDECEQVKILADIRPIHQINKVEWQDEVAPWDEIPDSVTVTKLPPAKITTMQELADAQAHGFNVRYYGNEGKPYYPHQEANS